MRAKRSVYAIHDAKAKDYGTPVFSENDATAFRSFGDWLKDPAQYIGKHPEDFDLFCLGEYDSSTGDIVGISLGPRLVAKGVDLFPKK